MYAQRAGEDRAIQTQERAPSVPTVVKPLRNGSNMPIINQIVKEHSPGYMTVILENELDALWKIKYAERNGTKLVLMVRVEEV